MAVIYNYVVVKRLTRQAKSSKWAYSEIIHMKPPGDYHKMAGNYLKFLNEDGYYVYQITNNVNNTIYIGCTKKLRHRLILYSYDVRQFKINNKDKRDVPIIRAISKYGFDNFSFNILGKYSSYEEMIQAEKDNINKARSQKNYNICDGGNNFSPVNHGKGLASHNSLLSREQISNVFFLYHEKLYTVQQTHEETRITKTVIKNLLNGRSYQELTLDLIKKYGNIRKNSFYRKNVGDKNPSSKIKSQDIENILSMYFECGISIKKIAQVHNVVPSTISWILEGKHWNHLTKILFATKYKNHYKVKHGIENK